MVGRAINRILQKKFFFGKSAIVVTASRQELDLTNQKDVSNFFINQKPDIVIIAAARVGGIYANNTFPAEFIYENLMIQNNLIHASYLNNVQKLLFLGSSCIYPKLANQPMLEDDLLSGKLEPTNEPYAIAKIAGIKMCESYNRQYSLDYRSVMPTNLYGPGDNYHSENSHVLPAMIRRFHEATEANANEVVIWGTGKPRRELMHVDDLASGVLFILGLEQPPDWVNLGTGIDHSILEIAQLVKKVTGFQGQIVNDLTKQDGMPVKRLDVTLVNSLGWKALIPFEKGVQSAYEDFLQALKNGTARL